MGELRPVKGIDVLIDAIALLHRDGRAVTATLVGDGPDRDALQAQVERTGLWPQPFASCRRCRRARRRRSAGSWWCPRRAESLPYVVLEAAAAGMPLITTKVGGIPEIYGPSTCAGPRRGCRRAGAGDRAGARPARRQPSTPPSSCGRGSPRLSPSTPWSMACSPPTTPALETLATKPAAVKSILASR